MGRQATKRARETVVSPEIARSSVMMEISHADIAALAYRLWERRGCPDGTAEQDWREAERQLKSHAKG